MFIILEYNQKRMQKKVIITLVLLCIAAILIAGCSRSTPTQAIPNQAGQAQSTAIAATNGAATAQNDFSKVTHAEISTMKAHWSSGAEDDGIAVYPDLLDVSGTPVTWSGTSLPVDIEIYSTKYDSSYKESKDQLIYKGTGTISSWKDGNMFMGGGIQVPFASMKVPAGKSYGWTYATVHMPDGKTYSAIDKLTALTP